MLVGLGQRLRSAAQIAFSPFGIGSMARALEDKVRELYSVEDAGAVGDNTIDDRAAIQQAIDNVNAAGGGEVWFKRGATYKIVAGGAALHGNTVGVVLKAKVKLKLNGAILNIHCGSGNQVALWVYGDDCEVDMMGGAVNCISSGSPSSQFFFHAAISIGIHLNSGDTVASPNPAQYVKGWRIHGGTLSTTRARCPVIQGIGGCHHGKIDHIEIGTSSAHSGIHFDWGSVGTVSSSDVPGTRTTFDAGNCFTTHPNNIDIDNIRAGSLTAASSADETANLIRLSGCYGIRVNGARVDTCAYVAKVIGGDLGFEFAPAAIKRHACRGIVLDGLTLNDPQVGAEGGVYIDTFADNVHAAQFTGAYSPLIDPRMHGNIVVRNCSLPGSITSNEHGIRIIQARGVRCYNNTVSRWDKGIWVDEFTQDIDVIENDVFSCQSHGIEVGNGNLREDTVDVKVRGNRAYNNGTNGTADGIRVSRGTNIDVDDNVVGVVGEASQARGIHVVDSSTLRNVRLRRNHVNGATTSAYTLLAGTPSLPLRYRQMSAFDGNTADPSCYHVSNGIQGGTQLVVVRPRLHVESFASEWDQLSSSDPADGIWYAGDLIKRRPPVAGGYSFKECTTSGQFGTLGALTNGATTNGSKAITCSLQSLTANTTQNSYQVTVSSATNIRVGLKCSISAAGITNARILSVSGTTLELDTKAKSTQTGATFTTAGLVEGEVVSLDTTPARSSCVVMKIDGNSVTLDTAMGSTETGRTLSFTTPVFKNHAAITA